ERPRRGRQIPDGLPVALGVERLDAAVSAVRDVDDVVVVDDEAVRRVEVARLPAPLAPRLHEIPVLVVLRDARVAVAVGDEHGAVAAPADVRLLIETGSAWHGPLDDVGQIGPRLRIGPE